MRFRANCEQFSNFSYIILKEWAEWNSKKFMKQNEQCKKKKQNNFNFLIKQ